MITIKQLLYGHNIKIKCYILYIMKDKNGIIMLYYAATVLFISGDRTTPVFVYLCFVVISELLW